jgi:hypothetical protein
MDNLPSAKPLGGQKLFDLLHELAQEESQTRIFCYGFLQRLPVDLRIILFEDKDSTLPMMVARADQLWAHSAKRLNAAVNAVAEENNQL